MKPSLPSLRVGVIGAGKVATDAHLPVLKAMTGVELVWLLDNDSRRCEAVASAFRITPLAHVPADLSGTDVVLLAVPLLSRTAYLERFADSPVAVLSEKPLAITSHAHSHLLRTFQPWRLSVGYQRRMYATLRSIKQILDARIFGKPRCIRIAEGNRVTRAGDFATYQDLSFREGGGITLNLGCHTIDLAIWMYSACRFEIEHRYVVWDEATDRHASSRLRLFREGDEDGCLVDWTVSWLEPQPNTIEVEFESVTLSVPITPANHIVLRGPSGAPIGQLAPWASDGGRTSAQCFYCEWQDVLTSVSLHTPGILTANSSLLTAQVIDAVLAP
jgi:predicted dehydrogenase